MAGIVITAPVQGVPADEHDQLTVQVMGAPANTVGVDVVIDTDRVAAAAEAGPAPTTPTPSATSTASMAATNRRERRGLACWARRREVAIERRISHAWKSVNIELPFEFELGLELSLGNRSAAMHPTSHAPRSPSRNFHIDAPTYTVYQYVATYRYRPTIRVHGTAN